MVLPKSMVKAAAKVKCMVIIIYGLTLPKQYCQGCGQSQMDIVIGIVIATAKRTCSSNVNIMWICQAGGGERQSQPF